MDDGLKRGWVLLLSEHLLLLFVRVDGVRFETVRVGDACLSGLVGRHLRAALAIARMLLQAALPPIRPTSILFLLFIILLLQDPFEAGERRGLLRLFPLVVMVYLMLHGGRDLDTDRIVFFFTLIIVVVVVFGSGLELLGPLGDESLETALVKGSLLALLGEKGPILLMKVLLSRHHLERMGRVGGLGCGMTHFDPDVGLVSTRCSCLRRLPPPTQSPVHQVPGRGGAPKTPILTMNLTLSILVISLRLGHLFEGALGLRALASLFGA